jgi:hypothetical protein
MLGKTPSALQSILPLQIQRKSILPIQRVELATLTENSQEFYREEGGDLTGWATLTRLLREAGHEVTIWC